MNRTKNLILIKGEDYTSRVKFCKFNKATKKYDVTFITGQAYSYNYYSIEWVRNPETKNPINVQITYKDKRLFNIKKIYVFHAKNGDYWFIQFANNYENLYRQRELDIIYSCTGENKAKDCLAYLKDLAEENKLKDKKGKQILKERYEELDFVGEDTAMALYLNPSENKIRNLVKPKLIFPFGGNASQFKAIENAMCNQISVIQGPPGTGKTQTILNIIANLLINGKTVQIVSNNNSATQNVSDKLESEKYGLGFLTATLGKKDNKNDFFANQKEYNPDLHNWEINYKNQIGLLDKIQNRAVELTKTFEAQEQIAKMRTELDLLQLEHKHFAKYFKENYSVEPDIKTRRNIKSETLITIWHECANYLERKQKEGKDIISLPLIYKLKYVFLYGLSDWELFKNDAGTVVATFQYQYFEKRKTEISNQIDDLEKYLEGINAERKMEELTEWSMDYLRAKLFDQYGKKSVREKFTKDDDWKRPEDILKEYPIVLSTTFSSQSSLANVSYDYVIMDEASQVDIATGALSLSSAKNAVIVGDLKQLPNVVTREDKMAYDKIFSFYDLPKGYSASDNSFLKSICSVISDVPETLLREHYRCQPQIINFCNQKFYNGELVIMTKDNEESDTLSVVLTNIGNHQRGRINQRQIDVTVNEVLPKIENTKPDDIGIIAPYRAHVNTTSNQIGIANIEIDTVHKFQGREKDVIVLTTVDDVVTSFSDDPYLLNVAISRAKKKLWLVSSANEQPKDSNIRDLIDYIKYNKFEIVNSKVYSVFDLLYKQYTKERIEYLEKHKRISKYDSENIMFGNLEDILKKRSKLSLSIALHKQLNTLIKDKSNLNEDELKFVKNPATHVDFLIYKRVTKEPVLVIEVDGYDNHMNDEAQYIRDRKKDKILKEAGVQLLRLPTNGSREIEKIEAVLDEYEKSRES